MAQAWPKAKPKLTQEAFDEAVASNIEDFDMPREEAISNAIKEFELQGYDLSGVVTNLAGEELQSHPIAVAAQGLREACGGEGSLPEALEAFAASLQASTSQPSDTDTGTAASSTTTGTTPPLVLSQEQYVIAHKGASMQSLLEACRRLQSQPDQLLKALGLLQVLLGWLETRDAFTEAQGVELLHDLLRSDASSTHVKAAAAAVAEAAARGVEETKCRLVDSGLVATLLELLQAPGTPPAAAASTASTEGSGAAGTGAEQPPQEATAAAATAAGAVPLELVGAACGVLRAVTTADDERPPASKAFMHARVLAKSHGAIRVLLGVLRRVPAAQEPATACRVLGTVRQVAANEEICREFTDDGGVMACLQVLSECAAQRDVCRACLGALRQLAHSDTVKRLLAAAGAVPLAVRCVDLHAGADDVAEGALGLLGNMMLRQPEICSQAAEAGVIDTVVEAMQRHPARAPVQRQACLLVRVMAARNPELRPPFLERGVEGLLRAAKVAHPAACRDVGAAALRDLGLDNYND